MDNIIILTRKLIECKSFCQNNVNSAMDFAAEALTSWGLNPRIITNQGYKMIAAEIGQGDRTIILNGHLDVVPGKMEQYHPQVRDGKIIGRGAYDMLGAAATMMDVMRVLYLEEQQGNSLGVKVILMLVPTEETEGSIGTDYLLKNWITGDFAICGEPTNLNIATMHKGVLQIRVYIDGKPAHGAKPWLGENAILKAVDIYKRIIELPFAQYKNAFYSGCSLNLGVLTGGDVVNKVPDSAKMDVDIRYLHGQSPQDIIREIKCLDETMQIEIIRTGLPLETDPENCYVKKLAYSIGEYIQKSGLIAQHGTADTRFFQEAGIPSIQFGPVGANLHGDEEYVEIQSLLDYKAILVNFIHQLQLRERRCAKPFETY